MLCFVVSLQCEELWERVGGVVSFCLLLFETWNMCEHNSNLIQGKVREVVDA